MRVITGAIAHETSTFTPVATTWENYRERFGYLRGEEMLTAFRGSNSPIGGFIEGADAHGFELIPTAFGQPQPSGPTPRVIFDEILGEMLERTAAAGSIDGVLLELHGSMVAEGIDDGEGHILTAMREQVGADVPILVQLDIHSNISPLMVEMADVLIGRETYPEVDMAARGRECADVLARIWSEGLRPTMALHRIPMIWGMNQVTAHPPMREAIEYLHQIEARPGIICGSIATGYPLADVPDMGSSVYVVADGNRELAQTCADELGEWIFGRKEEWQAEMPSTQKKLVKAEEDGRFPVIFADRNDNTGGGSPGDSTGMLRAFLEAGLQDACVLYIVDPEAIARCEEAMQGKPCRMTVEVTALSDGRFFYDGPMYAGLQGNMGPSAHVQQEGIHVLLVSHREQPFCTAFSRTLDLDPRAMKYIGVKSAAHFRAGFEEWAGAIHLVGEPSVHSGEKVAFRNLGRKLYPFDEI